MSVPSTYKGVISRFKKAPPEIRKNFPSFINLIKSHDDWNVSVSYIFTRVEYIKHLTIYRGIVKLHRGEANFTWKVVDSEHMSRKRFIDLFEIVFGKPIKKSLLEKLQSAEKLRDKVVHGKSCDGQEIRKALVDIIEFAEGFNEFVYSLAGFLPFTDDMRGFKGRTKPLEKSTTRWVLKGMGFSI